jgi:outer membrane protein OmpA-like peptidoglycan-associated protein
MTEMYRARRSKSALGLATALSLTLAGCSSVPDALNPVEWYNTSSDAVGGWFDDSEGDQSGDTGAYPNVSSVPEKPAPRTSAVERADIKEELVADRAHAQYDDKAPAPSVNDASTTSLSQIQPTAPAAPAPSAPSGSDSAEPIKPVRMTASDEATKQMEEPAKPAASSLPSRTVTTASDASPRSSLWPNSPAPESASDRPVTSGDVGEPTTRSSRADLPNPSAAGERYKSLVPSRSSGDVAAESMPAPAAEPAKTEMPAPEPARQSAAIPTAPEPAPEPVSQPEPTPAPVAVPAPAPETGALGLNVPDNGPYNFNDPSVIVDESALPGAVGGNPAGEGGSYQAGVIRFSIGSSQLSGADQGVIRELVPLIREYNATVEIVGHASSRTRNMDPAEHKLINFEVSLKRANAVAQALINAGAPSDRISVVAVGDSQPVSSEAMPLGEAENRRAEIYLIY